MTGLTLASAIRGVPRPPCDGCRHRLHCATKQLACRDFSQYVNCHPGVYPSDRTPSKARYVKAFPNFDDEE